MEKIFTATLFEEEAFQPQEDYLSNALAKLEHKPLNLPLNKEVYINKVKILFASKMATITIAVVLFAAWFYIIPLANGNPPVIENFGLNVMLVLILTVIYSCTAYLLYAPVKNARENTPDSITVYHDRIVFNEKTFLYSNLKSVQMTMPNTSGERFFKRVIIISSDEGQFVYALGDDSDNAKLLRGQMAVFKDYNKLFNTLNVLFTLRAEDTGTANIFSADLGSIE